MFGTNKPKTPLPNTIWKCVGASWGHNDFQQVIEFNGRTVITISYRENIEDIDWSGLWPVAEFLKAYVPV